MIATASNWTPQMKIKMPMVLAAPLLLSACAVGRLEPMNVPLKYTANSRDATVVGNLSCAAVAQVQVADGRADKTLGERVHESKPLTATVTTSSDVAAWVQDGVQTMLTQNGFKTGSGPKLNIVVDSVRTKESVWHRASYDAQVVFKAQLLGPSGNACWTDTIQGRDGAYGYAGSVENYQQALNNALDTASLNLAQLGSFKEALCKCGN
jgi:uncharacterized lipoprotein YajG